MVKKYANYTWLFFCFGSLFLLGALSIVMQARLRLDSGSPTAANLFIGTVSGLTVFGVLSLVALYKRDMRSLSQSFEDDILSLKKAAGPTWLNPRSSPPAGSGGSGDGGSIDVELGNPNESTTAENANHRKSWFGRSNRIPHGSEEIELGRIDFECRFSTVENGGSAVMELVSTDATADVVAY